ncbi:hypothetical protein E0Z10_g3125 [Xylaria hypoxylon]|uniref:Uncharacterized protein n=1 Tax=Xylaria hypoxylon TaxID=37992 RepID=A0A4Z0YP05_9PEZI|nr:hypothetical protein E0Z10_g3125 [Xylaria hypoxylon]
MKTAAVVLLLASVTNAIQLTCWKGKTFSDRITGIYDLNDSWQTATACNSAKWTADANDNSCVWIRGTRGEKKWNAHTTDFPTHIFKDVGYNSEAKFSLLGAHH